MRLPLISLALSLLSVVVADLQAQDAAATPGALAGVDLVPITPVTDSGPRVLCVVAHPDDEIAFGATIYKISTHLGGAVDLAVITNGEAGYKYSLLAERIYKLRLTDPEIGRRELPRIRKAELIESARVLNVRDLFLLGQTDHRYTTEVEEVLGAGAEVWDLDHVAAVLDELLATRGYRFVFGHLPSPASHGHHQAATVLALEAVARMVPSERPVVLGSFGARDSVLPSAPEMLAARPLTRHDRQVGPFRFDREQKFGFRDQLDYRVVTNLAMAQHRSQGVYLTMLNRGVVESFMLFSLHAPDAAARAGELFARLAEPQFDPVDYDADGNLVVPDRR